MRSKVLFFGGKGGVGKTTVSSACALKLSENKRVLLISTDPAHSLSDIFEVPYEEGIREVYKNLHILEIDPVKEAEEYINKALETLEALVKPEVFGHFKEMVSWIKDSPGTEEAAIIEALSRVIVERFEDFDVFIIDTAPTGHTLRMLRSISRIGMWLEDLIRKKKEMERLKEVAGVKTEDRSLHILQERRRRLGKFSEILEKYSEFIPVINPEKLPLEETKRLVRELLSFNMKIEKMVVNKLLPDSEDEFLKKRKEIERKYLEEIKREFKNLKLIYIPLKEKDIRGIDSLKEIAEYL